MQISMSFGGLFFDFAISLVTAALIVMSLNWPGAPRSLNFWMTVARRAFLA
jgi:hypothetical protein